MIKAQELWTRQNTDIVDTTRKQNRFIALKYCLDAIEKKLMTFIEFNGGNCAQFHIEYPPIAELFDSGFYFENIHQEVLEELKSTGYRIHNTYLKENKMYFKISW
jgi:hypothetical protein